MTQEQKIEVAEKLASIAYPKNSGHCGYSPYKRGAFAGMNYCQPELEALQKETKELRQRNNLLVTANIELRGLIGKQDKENAELKEKLREATEWCDAKTELPEDHSDVLLLIDTGDEYCADVGYYTGDCWFSQYDGEVIKWRKINP